MPTKLKKKHRNKNNCTREGREKTKKLNDRKKKRGEKDISSNLVHAAAIPSLKGVCSPAPRAEFQTL